MSDDVEREAEAAFYRYRDGDDMRFGPFNNFVDGFKAARATEQREPGKLSPEWLHHLPKVPAQPTTAELVGAVRECLNLVNVATLHAQHLGLDALWALTELARRAGGE